MGYRTQARTVGSRTVFRRFRARLTTNSTSRTGVFCGARSISCDRRKSPMSATVMKVVQVNRGEIGLLVELPTGPHVVDIAKSLGVFAHDLVSGGLVNGALKEQCAWAALVNNWAYLRMPFELLARTALA